MKEALAKCEYMAKERIGPIYIYGPIGSGKTSTLRRLYERLAPEEQYQQALLISPNIKSANSYLRLILEAFDVKIERAYDQSLKNFEQFLIKQYEAGITPLLLVDEAQNMNRESLRLIHYLLNFETARVKLLQIVLVGQEELGAKILRYPELASRMFPIAILPMSFSELQHTIAFRWMVAGGKDTPPFEEAAYPVIATYTKGLPRDAMKVCDETLRALFAQQQKQATPHLVEQVAKDLHLTP
ncbi:MAG: ATP-binding protein [Thermoproteota archaeon]|nr:ATP-binding protein [Thermoproteota archaeon]